ncbi:hypothetical protein DBV15_07830 [Temnothorax longispinosus]|uniref:Uncharacterized protein n=1 Tax=Temnothorax longispinosus TaxID=300112 RepID=A0A4S2K4V7_9HYME|nr:hypothetical protein DBV15_07830 [Temnothorax longispinosus]
MYAERVAVPAGISSTRRDLADVRSIESSESRDMKRAIIK